MNAASAPCGDADGNLLGSIPFGLAGGRWWGGNRPARTGFGLHRRHQRAAADGQGAPALVVFLLDVLKAAAAAVLARALLQPL